MSKSKKKGVSRKTIKSAHVKGLKSGDRQVKRKREARVGTLGGTDPTHDRRSEPNVESMVVPANAATSSITKARDPRLPPAGTTLVKRDRRGTPICECLVREEDVVYKGNVYTSLSGAATAAAKEQGQRGLVNGFVYFQIIKPNAKATPPTERLRRIGERYEEQAGALLATGSGGEIDEQLRAAIELHLKHVQRMVAPRA